MTQTTHTKGPWEMVKGDRQIIITGDDKSYDIAIVRCVAEKFDNEANARLIAAAPELLDACEEAMAEFDKSTYAEDMSFMWAEKMQAAIAKARGKS